MEYRDANHFALFIANDDIVLGEFAVVGVAGLLETQIKHVRLLIIAIPDALERNVQEPWS
jgi:hypothetical protein